jgi:hypothetical protein
MEHGEALPALEMVLSVVGRCGYEIGATFE